MANIPLNVTFSSDFNNGRSYNKQTQHKQTVASAISDHRIHYVNKLTAWTHMWHQIETIHSHKVRKRRLCPLAVEQKKAYIMVDLRLHVYLVACV